MKHKSSLNKTKVILFPKHQSFSRMSHLSEGYHCSPKCSSQNPWSYLFFSTTQSPSCQCLLLILVESIYFSLHHLDYYLNQQTPSLVWTTLKLTSWSPHINSCHTSNSFSTLQPKYLLWNINEIVPHPSIKLLDDFLLPLALTPKSFRWFTKLHISSAHPIP